MPEFRPVFTKQEIRERVEELAREISNDYQGQPLIVIGVLNGAFIFLADLIRHLTIPIRMDFVRISSYGSSTTTSGTVHLSKPLETDIRHKDVLIVEDIIDTGLSLTFLMDYLKSFEPGSIRLCALIDKTERRERTIRADYIGKVVAKGFLVGYGLDYAEEYRGLPEIYELIF